MRVSCPLEVQLQATRAGITVKQSPQSLQQSAAHMSHFRSVEAVGGQSHPLSGFGCGRNSSMWPGCLAPLEFLARSSDELFGPAVSHAPNMD